MVISLKRLVEWNEKVGTESCHIFGLMGSGKSNFAFGLVLTALVTRKEFAITPADRMCEWRHFPMHPNYDLGFTILIPKGVELFYHGFKKEHHPEWFIEVDYDNLDVFQYLSKEKPLLAIYDQHLRISDRVKMWTTILDQVINRRVYVMKAINFLMHEAGILFAESARGKHWKNIKDFSELFVETRKAYVRFFLVSQLETEIEYTLRRKCTYKIIKQSFLRTEYAKPLRNSSGFLAINQYHLVCAGLYLMDNTFHETIEYKTIWKMTPLTSLTERKDNDTSEDKEERVCPYCNHSWIPRKRYSKKCPRCYKII